MYRIARHHDFFVGIDSDGCVFDTMELKHKECFIPHFICHYQLQAVSRYAREAWEFVNLYSKSRGTNRFPALVETLQRLGRRREVVARRVPVTAPEPLCAWIAQESRLGNPALEARVAATQDPDLTRALNWSLAVNRTIADMVRGVPPFPGVRESLVRLGARADLLVCSATPHAALRAEWQEHDLDRHVAAICGQEEGTKREILQQARTYPAAQALMVGDAPGDYRAAQANGCLFYPICPGQEDTCWQRLYEEGIERFFRGTFAGSYQQELLAEFEQCLPTTPPWEPKT